METVLKGWVGHPQLARTNDDVGVVRHFRFGVILRHFAPLFAISII